MTISVSSQFDGGRIKTIDVSDSGDIRLEIPKDNQSEFYQWFYFRLTGASETQCKISLENAGGAAYVEGWQDYQAVVSYDRSEWSRVDTKYENGKLIISHTPETDSVYFAYFAPYSSDRHADLIAHASLSERVKYHCLGSTIDGRDIDLLQLGDEDPAKKVVWIIARQHPGETMAEWWVEGFLERLLDEFDPVSREFLNNCTVYVVPNMNPDGSARGHLRTNAVGSNLNREWTKPTVEKSPEVYLVREKMHQTGMDFCLDVHGDEAIPHNFTMSSEGVPCWDDSYSQMYQRFQNEMLDSSPDFQNKIGYEIPEAGTADLSIATNYMTEKFKCLAVVLEMPFKDTENSPNPHQGWSPDRCKVMGAANLEAIYKYLKS